MQLFTDNNIIKINIVCVGLFSGSQLENVYFEHPDSHIQESAVFL